MTISVFVIDCEPSDVLASCLAALKELPLDARIEVRVFKPRPSESLMQARARASTLVETEFAVFLNPRYRVTDSWASMILQAHANGAAVVGGGVAFCNRGKTGERAAYLWEYTPAAPPIEAGGTSTDWARLLPGGNTSYRADILHKYDLSLYANEMDFHSELAAVGINFSRSSGGVVYYQPPLVTKYLFELFRAARDYSRSRGGTIAHRLLQTAARSIVLAPWLLLKNSARVWRKPLYRSWLPGSLPWFVLFGVIQTCGEVVGYLNPRKQEQNS